MKNKLLILILISSSTIFFSGCAKTNPPSITPNASSVNQTSSQNKEEMVNTLEDKLLALGSSLSQASNLSLNQPGENEAYNFSTGTKINSLYFYLKKQNSQLTALNLASPGAEMQDVLSQQLPQALKENPKYISLDPGADLVSQNSSLVKFKEGLGQILEKINPQTQIFLFNYPDFPQMRTASFTACQENKVGVNLENLNEKNILAFNATIQEIAKQKQNVVFVDIYNLLDKNDISDYDCLHPNLSGQEKIAAEFIKKINL